MFNKQERARREAAAKFHERRYETLMRLDPRDLVVTLDITNAQTRFHRKQAELWKKHVKAFDMAALRTAKLVGRK